MSCLLGVTRHNRVGWMRYLGRGGVIVQKQVTIRLQVEQLHQMFRSHVCRGTTPADRHAICRPPPH
jgi:hypothetical protein